MNNLWENWIGQTIENVGGDERNLAKDFDEIVDKDDDDEEEEEKEKEKENKTKITMIIR